MLTAMSEDGSISHFSGHDIVKLKHQLYARKRLVQYDLTSRPHKGRGAKRHYKALARFNDKERRATMTHLWCAARWFQTFVEEHGASLVLIDDFISFDPDRSGPPWEPYVRRWPWAELKGKIIDALTRRAGVTVEERRSKYISQRCPECGHTEEDNVIKMPVIRGIYVEKGVFKCRECGFSTDVDRVAVMNLLHHWRSEPPSVVSSMG
jgi:predicted Zn-ribbon and HTH transcriptional regulator